MPSIRHLSAGMQSGATRQEFEAPYCSGRSVSLGDRLSMSSQLPCGPKLALVFATTQPCTLMMRRRDSGQTGVAAYARKAGLPFRISQTAGAERKLPVPAFLVILPAVPAYSVISRTYVSTLCPLSKPSTRILNAS